MRFVTVIRSRLFCREDIDQRPLRPYGFAVAPPVAAPRADAQRPAAD
ncbi:MAG TPA: hypothetical protein VNJ02_03325 [Vicinamibacterales bacterium]|nr:hypothetical protein [Vicinamibacterales bacterium]